MAVKELRLMINFPHTFPLPDLSKQAEPRNGKRREEKRLERNHSVTQTKLQLYN